MRIVIVMQHVNLFRNLDTVVRELSARGHELTLLHGTRLDEESRRRRMEQKREKMLVLSRGIETIQRDIPNLTVDYRPVPKDRWHRFLRVGRQVVNLSIYMRRNHPSPDRVTPALEKRLPSILRKLLTLRQVRALLGRPATLAWWRKVEAKSPPSKVVLETLRRLDPELVLISPSIWPKNPIETDYVRAAKALDVPSVAYLNSWDNLTSKGTLHLLPDAFVLWNEALAHEAVELHNVPQEIIRVTGAPHLDRLFAFHDREVRHDMRGRMGCPSDTPYVVYLCSSRTLIRSETSIVRALARMLRRRLRGRVPTLVVRPHPLNADIWDGFTQTGVTIYPRQGDQADTPDAWEEYFDQLVGATCVVGLNTTAFLEAAVADTPCISLVNDKYHAVQGFTGHFRHLLSADFLEVCTTIKEIAGRVEALLNGEDAKVEQRRAFVESFLRPQGIDTPATGIVVDTLLDVAQRRPAAYTRPVRREPVDPVEPITESTTR